MASVPCTAASRAAVVLNMPRLAAVSSTAGAGSGARQRKHGPPGSMFMVIPSPPATPAYIQGMPCRTQKRFIA